MTKRNGMTGIAALLVAAIWIGIGGVASAQGPGGPPPGGPGGEERLFRALNLTDAQKAQIKALHDKLHTDADPYHEQLRAIHDQIEAVVEASAFDEAAARALLARETQIGTELHILEMRTHNAVYNVLTAEQKAKLAELKKNHPGPGGPGGPGHPGPGNQ